MAKRIRLSESEIQKIASEFIEKARKTRTVNGKITYDTETKVNTKNRIKISITAEAWLKMQALVQNFDTEVECYGLLRRNKKVIELYDILNYPHTADACSVRGDFEKHQEWLFSLPPEQFKHLRMHGHSHVRMSVTPSSTDMQFRNDTAAQLPDNDMYLFMILNKHGSVEASFYDTKKNLLYEEDDIDIDIIFSDGTSLDSFLREADTMVSTTREEEFYGEFN